MSRSFQQSANYEGDRNTNTEYVYHHADDHYLERERIFPGSQEKAAVHAGVVAASMLPVTIADLAVAFNLQAVSYQQ